MKKRHIGIIDVGSYSITAYVGNIAENGFNILADCEVPYSGYAEGEWLDESELPEKVTEALRNATIEAAVKVNIIYVGVPGEFSKVVTREVKREFLKEHRIGDKDINSIYDEADAMIIDDDFRTVNCSPIYYNLDTGKRTIDPKGCLVKSFSLLAGFVLCKGSFQDKFDSILQEYEDVKYISGCWAESISLLDTEKRDQGVILCDIGYLSSNVMLVRGDGLLDMRSFSKGGAHIAAELMSTLDVPYNVALKIKPIIDLNVELKQDETANVMVGGKEYTYNAYDAQEVAREYINIFGVYINKCISLFEYQCPAYMKVYITGGGIGDIRGAKTVIASVLDKAVEILSPNVPGYNKPRFSSALGIMDVVAKCNRTDNGLIKKLIKSIIGG